MSRYKERLIGEAIKSLIGLTWVELLVCAVNDSDAKGELLVCAINDSDAKGELLVKKLIVLLLEGSCG